MASWPGEERERNRLECEMNKLRFELNFLRSRRGVGRSFARSFLYLAFSPGLTQSFKMY